jgi:predicted transcriptional regulator
MRDFIRKQFGTITGCAEELGVTTVTVRNWINKNPRGILKHSPEIIRDKDVTFIQLAGEVLHREHILRDIEPTANT